MTTRYRARQTAAAYGLAAIGLAHAARITTRPLRQRIRRAVLELLDDLDPASS